MPFLLAEQNQLSPASELFALLKDATRASMSLCLAHCLLKSDSGCCCKQNLVTAGFQCFAIERGCSVRSLDQLAESFQRSRISVYMDLSMGFSYGY